MSRPHLDLTSIGTNRENVKMRKLDSTHIGTKMPDLTPLTRPTESLKRKIEAHIPEDLESYTSSLDSSLSESDSFDDSKYSKYKRKGYNKNKKRRKCRK